MNAMKKFGGRHGIKFTPEIADEMIFDADIDMVDKKVSF